MNLDRKNVNLQQSSDQGNFGKGAPSASPNKDQHPKGQTAKPAPDGNEKKPNKSAGQGAGKNNHDQDAKG
jgi:hypothetical protein